MQSPPVESLRPSAPATDLERSRPVTGEVWGPVGTWAGVVATLLVVMTTALVALGYFDLLRGPRLRLTFESSEPWCRRGQTRHGEPALWVRVGVENVGAGPARGCLGRLINVISEDEPRPDIDPVQLRWAGVPRSRAFDAMDMRLGQPGGGEAAVPVMKLGRTVQTASLLRASDSRPMKTILAEPVKGSALQ